MSLVSIIMPVYNTEKFLADAIDSVLNQTHQEWELLIVNDGSTDGSARIVDDYDDSRIKYFEQENKGVSAARNVGLSKMRGDYFCFLDADDILPERSLQSRLEVFSRNTSIFYVDGRVDKFRDQPENIFDSWQPNFKGNPHRDLITLGGQTFFGPTWMVRRDKTRSYSMLDGLSHGEDLLFYIENLTEKGIYDFTKEVILKYRLHEASAMNNLEGLEKGYHTIYQRLCEDVGIRKDDLRVFKSKVNRILFRSYLKKGALIKAFKSRI